jgi:N-acetylneuraminate synthase
MKITRSFSLERNGIPYIIAELGSNHNGDMGLAKKLIIEAKAAGANCVKFQSWSKDTIFAKKKYEDNYFIADDYRDRIDFTLEEIVDAYSITEAELLQMKQFCDEIGIDCSSTPFSKKEADFLVEVLDSPFIKVASMDLNNLPFLEYLAKKGRPMIISTGLSELYEIDKAVKTIESCGNNEICILHCVSNYPPKDEEVNLNNIVTLMQAYPNYPIGFSDHTIGTSIPLASVALGACLIEKHFTLDKNMEGWDHKVSATPDELKELIQNSSRVVSAMGSYRITAPESDEKKAEFRRSIVLTRPVAKGTRLTMDDFDFKRPGTGLQPEAVKYIQGRKANKDLPFDYIITMEDID